MVGIDKTSLANGAVTYVAAALIGVTNPLACAVFVIANEFFSKNFAGYYQAYVNTSSAPKSQPEVCYEYIRGKIGLVETFCRKFHMPLNIAHAFAYGIVTLGTLSLINLVGLTVLAPQAIVIGIGGLMAAQKIYSSEVLLNIFKHIGKSDFIPNVIKNPVKALINRLSPDILRLASIATISSLTLKFLGSAHPVAYGLFLATAYVTARHSIFHSLYDHFNQKGITSMPYAILRGIFSINFYNKLNSNASSKFALLTFTHITAWTAINIVGCFAGFHILAINAFALSLFYNSDVIIVHGASLWREVKNNGLLQIILENTPNPRQIIEDIKKQIFSIHRAPSNGSAYPLL
jgi:hypothetical protein